MTASPSPLKNAIRKACFGGVGLVGALMLTACVTGSHTLNAQTPASDIGDQRERLSHTRLQLAALHFQEGRNDVALQELAQSLQINPRNADAYNLQGWIHLAREDQAAARGSFDHALSLRPNDADTLYNLGWLLCQQRLFVQADQYFDASLSAPRSSDEVRMRAWLGKGVCLRQGGRNDKALQALEKAYELDPGNPAIAYNFADVLYAIGQTERALFYVRRLNGSPSVSAQSLWLGIRLERSLGYRAEVQQLADQLHRQFPDSQEWVWFEQGAFNE